ncbi:hypothetical protein MZO42_16205 [Sphingomonas psychrotolerans]|uniref:DnaA N-terminal domain-containing protein n=1 Tax=Sphingomonas psychrotolerans TaxID=1327635 RepID=A0ABU3N6T3_9SPHN|nr:hypothetical protein [Sphingomonas psychrotolerans]MDT8760244.1 hypothetical protein [Sphingomonas psychrotolerans]
MGIAIARLRLRGPPDRAALARFAIEDGIRTVWPDDGQLVLIRRVALGRTRPGQRPERRGAQFRRAWDVATQGRRHGGESNAGDANCVWFASRSEAWRLLLRELIAGRRPVAWFWRLAVPDWHGEPAQQWLAVALEEALAGFGRIEPVALVEAAVAEGGIDLLFAAAEQMTAAVQLPLAGDGTAADVDWPEEAAANAGEPPMAHRGAIALVLAIRAALPVGTVAAVERLVLHIGVAAPVARRLLERLLLRGSPALRLTPLQLAKAVHSYALLLAAGRVPAESSVRRAAERKAAAAAAAAKTRQTDVPSAGEADRRARPAQVAQPVQTSPPESEPIAAPLSMARLSDEAESGFAGLWLIVPVLIRLGFREWLIDHPDLAAADGGRRLIRAIGRHFDAGSEDPALLPFVDCAPGDPDFARPWRVALDFRLWRGARIRLHEVVRRQGWLRQTEERLVIRFDPESVDLRLRRHALDVDPGWTDWLGLSIRYLYANQGEP